MTPKKTFFLMLGGVLVVLGLAGFGYYFTRQQLYDKTASLSKVKADVDAIDDSIEDTKNVLAQYEDLSFIDAIASDVLPPEKVQSDLIEQIYTLANEAGVTLRTINFTSPQGTPTTDPSLTQTVPLEGVAGVHSLPVSLSYETDNYSGFIRFLEKLEENRRKLQVGRLGINPVKESVEGGGSTTRVTGYQGTLELNVYVRP